MSLFDITPTHSPPPPHSHILDSRDIDPILLQHINKPLPRKPVLIPASFIGLNSQFDSSFPRSQPCKHTQPESSLPPPATLTIPVHEPFDTLREMYALSEVDSTTFSFIYPRPLLLNLLLNTLIPHSITLYIPPPKIPFVDHYAIDTIFGITLTLLIPLQVLMLL